MHLLVLSSPEGFYNTSIAVLGIFNFKIVEFKKYYYIIIIIIFITVIDDKKNITTSI